VCGYRIVLQVQQLLAAAPEALKALGLAFRAFVIAPGSSPDINAADNLMAGAAVAGTAAAAVSPTAKAQQQLLQQLSQSYRLYISQPAEYEGSVASSTVPDGCDAFATAVLGLSASALLLLPGPGQQRSIGSGDTAAAALSGCLPLLLAAVRKGVPVHCVGPMGEGEQQGVLAAAAAAGWSDQVSAHTADVTTICGDVQKERV
jgi:hypothetical protein